MDESWRMRMGPTTHRRRQSAESSAFEPEDFNDVFGGPPRSVLARKHSADFTASEWFYQEIFQESEAGNSVIMKEGQRLPEFRIPEQRAGKVKVRPSMSMSMSMSMSTSSSVMSFEEELTTPFRSLGMVTVGQEDVALSSFTSRLRPINVPYRWSSTSTSTSKLPKCKNNKQDLPAFGCNNTAYIDNNPSTRTESTINNFIFGFPQPIPSPEIINFDPNSVNMQLMVDYHLRPQSPSSTLLTTSFRRDHEAENMIDFSFEERVPKVDVYEDDMMSSSYIIEVNSHSTTEANNSEAIDIDEAIAWAKEQFQG